MRIIEPGYEILTEISEGGVNELKHIEKIGRVCYKSEDRITEDGESARKFIKMLIDRGHEAMTEHSSLSVKFTVDRGVSHELVRHRIASFAQESTRYCNYSKDKFDNGVTFIKPYFFDEPSVQYDFWKRAMEEAEYCYLHLLEKGATPQEARSVLPNSTKTEITITANYREWRSFFKLRTAKAAHPQMVQVTRPLLMELKEKIPVIFDDIKAGEEKKLDKHIFIINGSGGAGKDTFVELVSVELNNILKKFHTVINFSSVDRVKEIAKEIGWNGRKSERDRKFLSDLKILVSEYCDMPFESMKNKVNDFLKDKESKILFLHIREPEEIERAVKEFGAKTVLINRKSVKHITSNMADGNVFNYSYDITIDNSGTKEELNSKAKKFVQEVMRNEA